MKAILEEQQNGTWYWYCGYFNESKGPKTYTILRDGYASSKKEARRQGKAACSELLAPITNRKIIFVSRNPLNRNNFLPSPDVLSQSTLLDKVVTNMSIYSFPRKKRFFLP